MDLGSILARTVDTLSTRQSCWAAQVSFWYTGVIFRGSVALNSSHPFALLKLDLQRGHYNRRRSGDVKQEKQKTEKINTTPTKNKNNWTRIVYYIVSVIMAHITRPLISHKMRPALKCFFLCKSRKTLHSYNNAEFFNETATLCFFLSLPPPPPPLYLTLPPPPRPKLVTSQG